MKELANAITVKLFLKNPFYWLFIISGLIAFIFRKKIIGKAGEDWVNKEIKKLPCDKYMIINDVMIESDNNTHQIDHIIVSPYGIFVIETKQYNGYITGSEYDKKWIQNRKYYLNNPIHQNYGHVKCLEEVLNLTEDKFIPIVCIPSRAKVNVKAKSHVVRINNLNDTILFYTDFIIDNPKEIASKINKLNIKNITTRRNHVKKTKEFVKKAENENKNKCPKCGGNLIEKSGRYGKFIGCSNYPKCKYTRQI